MLVLAALVSAFALLGRLRTTGSRYLPLGLAAVGFAAVLALVMAGDYVTDYVDPLEFGPLVLAAVGVGLTLVAFVALQRYLQKRIPIRRVRKGECPFCGFPGREGSHCEGCGRAVVADCAACSEPRRVGARPLQRLRLAVKDGRAPLPPGSRGPHAVRATASPCPSASRSRDRCPCRWRR